MVWRFITSIFFVVVSFLYQNVYALSVGSNTAASRQGSILFPRFASDNALVGFASFENGFKLTDNATSCSYNNLWAVSGNIDFNGGNLYLMESLVFSNTTQINSMGSWYGNGKTITLPSTVTRLQSTAKEFMVTLTSYNVSAPINSIDFCKTESYVLIASNNTFGAPELRIAYFDGYSLTMTASTEFGRNALCCQWQPGTTNCVVGRASGTGAELFSYSYNISNGIFGGVSAENPTGNKTINALRFSPGGNYLLIGRSIVGGGSDNQLFMYSVTTGGVLTELFNQAIPGTFRDVSINAISWSPGGNYLAVGTVVSAGNADLLIYNFDGTTLTPTIQMIIGRQVRGVDWSPSGTFIAVALVGTTTQNVHIFAHNISNGTLTPQTSAYINQTTDAISVAWTADGNELAVGTKRIGGISAMRKYSFDSSATTLSLIKSFTFYADVNALSSFFYNDNYVMGVGNVSYVLSDQYPDGYTLTIDNLKIELQNDVTLAAPLGFKRNCQIIGNNHRLDFDVTGTMIILPQASLYLKDVTLSNFGGTQLRCLDNTATISLDNVRFIFKSPYYFDAGQLYINSQFMISGTNPFVYRSTASSFVGQRSSWVFDMFATLSYAPESDNRQGIILTDQSSSLVFNHATLYATATGLWLTKGNMIIDGNLTLISDATSVAEGIQWGTGISLDEDLFITIMPHARMSIASGFVVNRNVS
jgi:hypothetical protein